MSNLLVVKNKTSFTLLLESRRIRNLKKKMGAVCWEQCGGWNTNDLMGLVEAIVDSYRDTSPPMLRVDKSSGKCRG